MIDPFVFAVGGGRIGGLAPPNFSFCIPVEKDARIIRQKANLV